ncbi:MAG: hypothetical protein ACT4P9_14010 [Betaproteobacteria bacterium]
MAGRKPAKPVVDRAGFAALLADVKGRIQTAQTRAKVPRAVAQMSSSPKMPQPVAPAKSGLPDGYGPAFGENMRVFAAAWPDAAIVQRALHKLPWSVNVKLLDAAIAADLKELGYGG